MCRYYRRKARSKLHLLLLCSFILLFICVLFSLTLYVWPIIAFWRSDPRQRLSVHLSVVVCGKKRVEETLIMLKSAVMLVRRPFHVHIFADGEAFMELKRTDLLKDVDSLIYVDTDVIFLSSPELLWDQFDHFKWEHIAALAPETEDIQTNWYVRFARHPFHRPLGVNSGVMLMNLTRMRRFRWGEFLWPLYEQYRNEITWGDQDIINIIFSSNSEKLYIYGCEWNFRPDHCMHKSTCKKAEQIGAQILHGSRRYFHKNDKQSSFRFIYLAFHAVLLNGSICLELLPRLEAELVALPSTLNCARTHDIFLRSLQRICQL